MSVTLFTTGCPRCKILEDKLTAKHILFSVISGERAIESIQERGYMSAPLLSVDGEDMDFGKAIRWVNER